MPEMLARDGPIRAAAFLIIVMSLAALSRFYDTKEGNERGFSALAAARMENGARTEARREGSSLLREGKIDLNTADREALMALPRIGPAMAGRIVQDREARGPYKSAEELMRVKGIGPKTFERLAPYLVAGPSAKGEKALETVP